MAESGPQKASDPDASRHLRSNNNVTTRRRRSWHDHSSAEMITIERVYSPVPGALESLTLHCGINPSPIRRPLQRGPAPLLPSAARDRLARRQKKLRLPNGSVVVMTPCAVDASAILVILGLDAPPRAEFYGVDDNRPKEALEDDEHPWWYMTAR